MDIVELVNDMGEMLQEIPPPIPSWKQGTIAWNDYVMMRREYARLFPKSGLLTLLPDLRSAGLDGPKMRGDEDLSSHQGAYAFLKKLYQ